MDELFGGMDCRFRFSMTDSIMMCIVHSAMNKAHEKLKSKEGVIERLIEISKFYELAVMQLEGCLKFVHEVTDSFTLESPHEEVLSDLTKIRDRLQQRLEDTELTILNKDRELTERLENEMKLRQALELKDREVVSLHANLVLERSKSEDLQELILSSRVSGDEGREGEISKLKNAVEQQVWNLKQKLGDGRKNMASGMRNVEKSGFDQMVDEEKSWVIENKKIEHMSLDIDNLKETLDLAFGKMQNAIFLSEVEPTEQQWRWTIEKDTICVLFKGVLRDFGEIFEPKVRKQEKSIVLLGKHWSDLMNEITSLRFELESLSNENEVQGNSIDGPEILAPSSQIKEGDDYSKSDCSSMKVEKLVDHMNEHLEEDQEGDERHFVAKMIKNHESIIRQKSEELNWMKREILREKEYSSGREEKDLDDSKRRIWEVIVRLDNLIDWNAKLGEAFGEFQIVCEEENFLEKMGVDTLADFCKKVDSVSVFHPIDEEQCEEIVKIKNEIEDSNLQFIILEDIYAVLFKGLIEEFYMGLYDFDTENTIREGICENFFSEMINECNKNIENNKLEAQIREEIYYVVFSEAVKDFGYAHSSPLLETQDATADCNSLQDSIREDVFIVFFREMVKEWNNDIESFNTQNLVREEICQIVFDETIKNIVSTVNSAVSRYQTEKAPDNFLCDIPSTNEILQSVESMVKENVYEGFFREMVKAWKMEADAYNIASLIREEIYQLVIVEAVKDAYISFGESELGPDHDNFSKDMLSTNNLNEMPEIRREDENLIQKLNSLLKCFEMEEDLMLSASTEIKEHNMHFELMGLPSKESGGQAFFEELSIEEKSTFRSVSGKLEKALQQVIMSKKLLSELGSSLCIAADKKHAFRPPKDNEDMELNSSVSVFSPLMGFRLVFGEFELTTHEKLGWNMLRLEEVQHQLEQLIEHAASLRKREKLYRKAFIRRCHNLHKAETEVDLLGDQVDVLLGLLEKIYTSLHHHSPVLQQYFGVSDILKLIKKELTVGAAHIPI